MTEKLCDTKKIRKEIYFLVIPIILENIFQISAGVVSAAMIGRFTANIISAQGVCSRVTGVLWCLFKGIGIGATVVIAKLHGGSDKSKCQSAFEQTILTATGISLLVILFIIFNANSILTFFTKNSDVLSYAKEYIRIVILGAPFLVIMSVVTGAFQGHGNTKTPMYIAIVVNLINICLGYVLIYGKFGFPNLGLNGAGIALVTSQASGAILGLILLYNKKNGIFIIHKSIKDFFRLNASMLKEIYTLGIPAAFESMFWQLSAVVMSKVILTYGEVSFAAYQLGLNAESIVEMPAIGLGVAATALTARAIGQKDDTLFKAYTKELIHTTIIISIVTSLILILLPNVFMNFLTNDEQIKSIGVKYIIAMGFIQLPQNLSKVLNGTMRSAGYKVIPMIISGVGIWVFRVPVSLLVAYVFKLDIVFIWLCMALDQTMKFTMSLIIFKYKKVNNAVERYIDVNA